MAKKKAKKNKKKIKKASRKASTRGKSMAGPKIKRGLEQCPQQNRIVIFWDNGIQVVPDPMRIPVTSNGVCWQSLDYDYRVIFKGGSPFTPPSPPDIAPGRPRGSGPPNPGSNRPQPYKYDVRRLGGNYPVLDPTIMVDP